MITKKDLPSCPVAVTMLFLKNKWTILILYSLMKKTMRFNELQRALPDISTKVLTETLRAMEDNQLVTRHVLPVVPPCVEYSLTDFGHSMESILKVMAEWGENYLENIN